MNRRSLSTNLVLLLRFLICTLAFMINKEYVVVVSTIRVETSSDDSLERIGYIALLVTPEIEKRQGNDIIE